MKSILLATADKEKMISLRDLLQKRGYFVIPAGDLDLALSFLDFRMPIDAVIVDYQLHDFSRLMRAARLHGPVPPPVIAMSERVAVTDYLDALSAGVFEFFFWPIRSGELLRIVEAALPQNAGRPLEAGRQCQGAGADKGPGRMDSFL